MNSCQIRCSAAVPGGFARLHRTCLTSNTTLVLAPYKCFQVGLVCLSKKSPWKTDARVLFNVVHCGLSSTDPTKMGPPLKLQQSLRKIHEHDSCTCLRIVTVNQPKMFIAVHTKPTLRCCVHVCSFSQQVCSCTTQRCAKACLSWLGTTPT